MSSLAVRAMRKARRIALQKTASIRSCLRAGVVGTGAIAPEHVLGYESTGRAQVVSGNRRKRPLSRKYGRLRSAGEDVQGHRQDAQGAEA
jgi:hypothetical protein